MSPALHTPFPTKEIYILIPTTCEYVMWYGKGELRLKIEWMMPITELNIRRVSMVQCNQKGLFKWKEAEEESERCGDRVGTERCFAAGFDDEAGDGS